MCAFFKTRIFCRHEDGMETLRLSARVLLIMSPIGSRHLGEIKTSLNDEKSEEQGTLQLF